MSNQALSKQPYLFLKHFYVLVNILFLSSNLKGQLNSFQYKIETDSLYSISNGALPVMANEEGELAIVVRRVQLHEPHAVLRISPNNGICQGYTYSLPDPAGGISQPAPYVIENTLGRRDWVYISAGKTYLTHLIALNLESGEYWCKKPLSDTFYDFLRFSLFENGDLAVLNRKYQTQTNPVSPHPSWMEVFRLDSLGNTVWKKGFLFRDTLQGEPNYNIIGRSISTDQPGNTYLSGNMDSKVSPNSISGNSHFLIKIDAQGNPIQWKQMCMPFGVTLLTDDALYLLDKLPSDYPLQPPNWESAIIAKFDHDLNLLWMKSYRGENFPFYTADITESPNGGLYLSCVTYGAFPVILAELDANGNIISQKGYPSYTPRVLLLDDGSLAISSSINVDSLGNFIRLRTIAKTDAQGNIEGCALLPTCLDVRDTTVEFGTFHIEDHPVTELIDVEADIQPISFGLTPYCNDAPAPVPDFRFPDTLCQNDIATTTETKNRLANAHEWHLAGHGVDSVNTDSFDFSFRFSTAGEYVLRHTVWVLGCSYEFEKRITVMPELEINITPEHICPDGPFEIGVFSERGINNYLWENGGTEEKINIAAPGIYSVEVSDGYCTAYDTSEVKFVSELIGDNNVINLPVDTTLCEINLPFNLKIESDFTDTFFINNDRIFNNEFSINRSGEYLIEAEIFNCPFSAVFSLTTSNCRAEIYLPNVFSPNGDGINDSFFPVGNGFEMSSLKIFDRWGGLRYDGQGTGAKWSPGLEVGQGSYLYLMVYKNILTRAFETVAGDVVLVR